MQLEYSRAIFFSTFFSKDCICIAHQVPISLQSSIRTKTETKTKEDDQNNKKLSFTLAGTASTVRSDAAAAATTSEPFGRTSSSAGQDSAPITGISAPPLIPSAGFFHGDLGASASFTLIAPISTDSWMVDAGDAISIIRLENFGQKTIEWMRFQPSSSGGKRDHDRMYERNHFGEERQKG